MNMYVCVCLNNMHILNHYYTVNDKSFEGETFAVFADFDGTTKVFPTNFNTQQLLLGKTILGYTTKLRRFSLHYE